MAVDITPTFVVALYILSLECFLFSAVVMQMKSQEPGTHGGIARSFGLIFLFEALGALFMVLSEQLFPGKLSVYSSLICVVCMLIAVAMCIPASAAVVFPEERMHSAHAFSYVAWLFIILLSTFELSTAFDAMPDIPYLPADLRRELLGAVLGGLVALSLSAAIRYTRKLKGANGALILYVGLAATLAVGLFWSRWEPRCRLQKASDPWPAACAFPRAFDHNAMLAVLMVFSNVAAAEGVLRLMAAGNGAEGYVPIA